MSMLYHSRPNDVMLGTRAWAVLIFNYFSWNFPVSVPEELINADGILDDYDPPNGTLLNL